MMNRFNVRLMKANIDKWDWCQNPVICGISVKSGHANANVRYSMSNQASMLGYRPIINNACRLQKYNLNQGGEC